MGDGAGVTEAERSVQGQCPCLQCWVVVFIPKHTRNPLCAKSSIDTLLRALQDNTTMLIRWWQLKPRLCPAYMHCTALSAQGPQALLVGVFPLTTHKQHSLKKRCPPAQATCTPFLSNGGMSSTGETFSSWIGFWPLTGFGGTMDCSSFTASSGITEADSCGENTKGRGLRGHACTCVVFVDEQAKRPQGICRKSHFGVLGALHCHSNTLFCEDD